MSITTQKMIVAGYTFILNPATDTDFEYIMVENEFVPVQARNSLTQIMGMKSGARTITGHFLADADFRTLEAIYRAAVPVACTDFLGNSFTALITALKPNRENDIAHNFESTSYSCTLRKTPG